MRYLREIASAIFISMVYCPAGYLVMESGWLSPWLKWPICMILLIVAAITGALIYSQGEQRVKITVESKPKAQGTESEIENRAIVWEAEVKRLDRLVDEKVAEIDKLDEELSETAFTCLQAETCVTSLSQQLRRLVDAARAVDQDLQDLDDNNGQQLREQLKLADALLAGLTAAKS